MLSHAVGKAVQHCTKFHCLYNWGSSKLLIDRMGGVRTCWSPQQLQDRHERFTMPTSSESTSLSEYTWAAIALNAWLIRLAGNPMLPCID